MNEQSDSVQIFLESLMMYIIMFSQKKTFKNNYILSQSFYKDTEF